MLALLATQKRKTFLREEKILCGAFVSHLSFKFLFFDSRGVFFIFRLQNFCYHEVKLFCNQKWVRDSWLTSFGGSCSWWQLNVSWDERYVWRVWVKGEFVGFLVDFLGKKCFFVIFMEKNWFEEQKKEDNTSNPKPGISGESNLHTLASFQNSSYKIFVF